MTSSSLPSRPTPRADLEQTGQLLKKLGRRAAFFLLLPGVSLSIAFLTEASGRLILAALGFALVGLFVGLALGAFVAVGTHQVVAAVQDPAHLQALLHQLPGDAEDPRSMEERMAQRLLHHLTEAGREASPGEACSVPLGEWREVGEGPRDLLVGACSRLLAETNYELVLKPAYASRRPREAPPAEAP